MDFKEKKEIKENKNEIENMKSLINENLEKINDVVIYNNYSFIIDDIRNNVAIDKYSMSSIFDFSEPLYSESKKYIENNTEFIEKLQKDKILHYIGNDFKDMFKNINITINLYIVNELSFDDSDMELDLYNMDIKEISDYIENNQYGYDVLDYICYLETIYNFYESLNKSIENMINKYGEYIL